LPSVDRRLCIHYIIAIASSYLQSYPEGKSEQVHDIPLNYLPPSLAECMHRWYQNMIM